MTTVQDRGRKMGLRSTASAGVLALVLAGVAPLAAHAHIDVDMGGSHESRADADQKRPPCGSAGSQRGTNVYTYRPGATINIKLAETIPHPGYFRIAFDVDGDDDFPIPTGTDGADGSCAGDPACGPGKEDYCSNDTVLLDKLSPHPAGSFLGGPYEYEWSVTLPNVECTNCTLQIIQMMNDFNFHPAPYPADDIYYRCIDIVLSNDAPVSSETPVTNDSGMVCQPTTMPPTPPAPTPTPTPGGAPAPAPVPTPTAGAPAPEPVPAPAPAPVPVPAPPAAGGQAPQPSPAPVTPQPGAGAPPPAAAAPPPVPPSNPVIVNSASSDDGGCHASSTTPTGLFGAVGIALAILGTRRRRAA